MDYATVASEPMTIPGEVVRTNYGISEKISKNGRPYSLHYFSLTIRVSYPGAQDKIYSTYYNAAWFTSTAVGGDINDEQFNRLIGLDLQEGDRVQLLGYIGIDTYVSKNDDGQTKKDKLKVINPAFDFAYWDRQFASAEPTDTTDTADFDLSEVGFFL